MRMPREVDFEVEIAGLAGRWGTPLRVIAELDDVSFDPIHDPTRTGEVLMAVRRPNGRLLLSIKTFYPRAGWRLPTGGIHPGESIAVALEREMLEETGLQHDVPRFLAAIEYRARGERRAAFRTFCFLLPETGGTLAALDESEQIEAFREIEPEELLTVAATLEAIDPAGELGEHWAGWGRFRAVAHRAVHRALAR